MKKLIAICCMCVLVGMSHASQNARGPEIPYTKVKAGTPEFEAYKRTFLETIIPRDAPCTPRTLNRKVQSVLDRCIGDAPGTYNGPGSYYGHEPVCGKDSVNRVECGPKERSTLEALRAEYHRQQNAAAAAASAQQDSKK